LLKSFKEVLKKEREAEQLVLEAEEQAKNIKKDAQEKAETVYKDTYKEKIAKTKRKSLELKEQAKTTAESESQVFVKQAEKLKKKILASAEKKFGEAVDSILKEILS
jgi:vacuolar-type H+-ATPase subunit H